MEQLCWPGMGLVNLLLLVMRVITVVTQVSWRQRAPKLLLEEFSCLPTAPYLSHGATSPPSTGGVHPLAEPHHENKWDRAVRNQVVLCTSSAVCSQKWAGGMRLLLGTAMVCACLAGHGTVVFYAGRAWFLKLRSKTHLWTGFLNSGSGWDSLSKCISKL